MPFTLCLLQAYEGFDIPEEFEAIWRYLAEAYKTEAFRSTMPSDQDIIYHYEKKARSKPVQRSKRPTLQNFTYTMDLPEDIAAKVMQRRPVNDTNGDISQEVQQVSQEVTKIDIQSQDAIEDEAPQQVQDEVTVDGGGGAGDE